MKRLILLVLLLNSIHGIDAKPATTSTTTLNYVPFEVQDDISARFRLYAPAAKPVTVGGDLKGVKSERSPMVHGLSPLRRISTPVHIVTFFGRGQFIRALKIFANEKIHLTINSCFFNPVI